MYQRCLCLAYLLVQSL
jgi:hypothetical protein